jgi:hypothetical protein
VVPLPVLGFIAVGASASADHVSKPALISCACAVTVRIKTDKRVIIFFITIGVFGVLKRMKCKISVFDKRESKIIHRTGWMSDRIRLVLIRRIKKLKKTGRKNLRSILSRYKVALTKIIRK